MYCLILSLSLLLDVTNLGQPLRNQEDPWNQNVHFILTQETMKTADKSDCWVCTVHHI